MKTILAVSLCGVLYLLPSPLFAADSAEVCLAMVSEAAHNVNLNTSSSQYLYTIFDAYCKSDGSTKQSSFNASLSAVVNQLPASLTLGTSDTATAFANFCRNYASAAAGSSSSYSMQSNVVQRALDSANQCMAIAGKGSVITYKVMDPKTLNISFNIGSGNQLNVRGLSHDTTVTCLGSKVEGSGVFSYSAGVGQSLSAALGSHGIRCTRDAAQSVGGKVEYAQTSMQLDTNAGEFDIYWPQDTVLPMTDADQIQAKLKSLEQELATVKSIATGAQGKIATAISNYTATTTGTLAEGPGAGNQQPTTSVACPQGQYLAGLDLVWGGTCNHQCESDGGILHKVIAKCKALF
jgi:hypothetical protein